MVSEKIFYVKTELNTLDIPKFEFHYSVKTSESFSVSILQVFQWIGRSGLRFMLKDMKCSHQPVQKGEQTDKCVEHDLFFLFSDALRWALHLHL